MAGFKGGRIDDDAVASRMIKKNNNRNDQHKPGRSKPTQKNYGPSVSEKDESQGPPSEPGGMKKPSIPKPFGKGGNVNDTTGIDTGGMMPQDSEY